jgi:SAM-dependent methyltransferase
MPHPDDRGGPSEEVGIERLPVYALLAEQCAGRRVLDLSAAAAWCAGHLVTAGAARVVVGLPPDWADAAEALPAGVESVALELAQPLPFDDGDFDIVMLLDRLGDLVTSARARLMAEVRRLLAPDGIVVAGLADPRRGTLARRAPAEGARGSADALPAAGELRGWLAEELPHVTVVAQSPFLGFSLVETDAAETTLDGLEMSDELLRGAAEEPIYWVAMAAVERLPAAGRSLLVQVSYQEAVRAVRARLEEARRQASEMGRMGAALEEAEQRNARWDRNAAELASERDALLAELQAAKVRLTEELRRQEESHGLEMRQVIEELSAERASLQADHAQLLEELPKLAEAGGEALRLREHVRGLEQHLKAALARGTELEAALALRDQDVARAAAEGREGQRATMEVLREEQGRALEVLRREHEKSLEAMVEAHGRAMEALRRELRTGADAREEEARRAQAAAEGAAREARDRAGELDARIRMLGKDVEAGVAARERVLAQYDEMLARQEELNKDRARLVERVDERERELDRARERVLAADARLREVQERGAKNEALLEERERGLAERDVTVERLRADLEDAEARLHLMEDQLKSTEQQLDEARAAGLPLVGAGPTDMAVRAQAAGTRVLAELMAKLEATEKDRARVEVELHDALAKVEDLRREAASLRGQNQALEDELGRLARELRAERTRGGAAE